MFDVVWSPDHGWCVADRGPRAGFLANISRLRGMDHKGTAISPNPRFQSHGTQASPPSSRRTVQGRGLKSWGGGFIWEGFCLGVLQQWIARFATRLMRHPRWFGCACPDPDDYSSLDLVG